LRLLEVVCGWVLGCVGLRGWLLWCWDARLVISGGGVVGEQCCYEIGIHGDDGTDGVVDVDRSVGEFSK
jgi:hypothetical protein